MPAQTRVSRQNISTTSSSSSLSSSPASTQASSSTTSLSSLKTRDTLRQRTIKKQKQKSRDGKKMFSSRKYTPLPGGNNSSRKRPGGGLATWKKYIFLGGAGLVVLGLGYAKFGGGHVELDTSEYNEENTYTPHLDGHLGSVDETDYSSPPFRPIDSGIAEPGLHETEPEVEEEEDTLHILPIDSGSPHDPTSTEAEEAIHSEPDFNEYEDDETSSSPASSSKTNGPTSFETDPDASATVFCSGGYDNKPIVQYALTIDAGSTGSRIHVYKFNNCGPSPQLEYETFMSIQPGLSSYARDPTAAAASLDPLMEEARRVVPRSLWHCTPVEVKATAGLRLLGAKESVAILDEVRNRLETDYEFSVNGERAVEIMDGKDEGVYAWITANYLLNKIGEGATSKTTLAVMDLGGASTQIVFEPTFPADSKQSLLDGEHKYHLSFGGKDFTLYQHSYLGYGLMRARRSVHNLVAFTWSFGRAVNWDTLSEDIEVANPCLAAGTTKRVELDPPGQRAVNVTMVGAEGGFQACNRVVELVMAKDAICEVKPCSFNGVYQPSLLDTFPNGQLLALSYFTDRIKPLLPPTLPFSKPSDSIITISELTQMAKDVCAGPKSWKKRWGSNKEAMFELSDRPEYCLDLTFMNALLGLGYELGGKRELMVEKKLKGVELGWALGAGLALVQNAELVCTA